MKKFRKDLNQKLDKAISTFMHVKINKNSSKFLKPVNEYVKEEIKKLEEKVNMGCEPKEKIKGNKEVEKAISQIHKEFSSRKNSLKEFEKNWMIST
mmetsp:Transcript_2054/g.1855  ORF Transcript_2054/g.1855 Transcript_2054/m.1855 type:complete len:96 (-) Transcript_2054:712-999(-)